MVGEGTRCWFGNQFSLIAPRFAAYGVDLWVPELGGKYDPRNPSHKMLMSVLGGMSESERQHVQARVRAAMDTQVVNEGRHQGGRAPYGYVVVDGGPHPNPRKAAEGYRLRVLAIDERGGRGGAADLRREPGRRRGPGDRRRAEPRRRARARRRGGRTRTGTGSPTAGRAARSGRSWRTRATPATRSSGGGPSTRCCSIRTTWRPVTSSDSGGSAPDEGRAVPEARASGDRRRVETFIRGADCCADHEGPAASRPRTQAGARTEADHAGLPAPWAGAVRVCARRMEGTPRDRPHLLPCAARTHRARLAGTGGSPQRTCTCPRPRSIGPVNEWIGDTVRPREPRRAQCGRSWRRRTTPARADTTVLPQQKRLAEAEATAAPVPGRPSRPASTRQRSSSAINGHRSSADGGAGRAEQHAAAART